MTDRFRHFLAIDWSGAKGPKQKGIAVAIADAAGGPPVLVQHRWSRAWPRPGHATQVKWPAFWVSDEMTGLVPPFWT